MEASTAAAAFTPMVAAASTTGTAAWDAQASKEREPEHKAAAETPRNVGFSPAANSIHKDMREITRILSSGKELQPLFTFFILTFKTRGQLL